MNKLIADTTVLVEHLRGNKFTKKFLEDLSPFISSVTQAEIIQGTRNASELKAAKILCDDLVILPITEKIAAKAIGLLFKFHLSHGLRYLDALIAATAIENNLTLVTGNVKHFDFIKDLKVKSWKEFER